MRQRGIALMVALMFAVFVLVLMLSVLAFVEQDNRFSATQQYNAEAFDTAMAGVECFKLKCNTVPVGQPLTGSLTPTQSYSVTVDVLGNIVSVGTVTNLSNQVVATRKVIVPALTYNELQDGSR